jgi:hypothetical protein
VMIRAIRVLRTRLWTLARWRAKQIDASNINADNLQCLWWVPSTLRRSGAFQWWTSRIPFKFNLIY